MKLTALKTFRHGVNLYRRGDAVEMSEAKMKPLLDKSLVGKTPESAEKKPKGKSEGQ
ncbi:hypothetical protein [Agrobacterium tumefaciens]|uniref:hypothetical protein n=1 Tax=Agrobacterium tumefaciens TaxID=358 RepID=UPI0021CF4837|nr:hypothetical protein [Agrobacterium tumefaciens]UXS00828.1 hypothetical protein FY156_04620 [Agrobacterium tumefaciens]